MKKNKSLLIAIVTMAACTMLTTAVVKAAPCQEEKFSFAQPDESKVDVIGTGDEFYSHIESKEGYTLTRNEEGFICYAKLNEDGTELEATDVVYTGNEDNVPAGLEKHLEITQESVDKKVKEAKEKIQGENECALDKMAKPMRRSLAVEDKTEVVGLTILVDFPDQESKYTYEEIDNLLNQKGYTGYGNNGSVHDFFYDISNGEIEYTNKILKLDGDNKIYFRAKHNKSYYDSAKRDCGDAAGELMNEISDWLKKNKDKVDLSGVSMNTDGSFTMLNIFYAGKAEQGWTEGLWPHKSNRFFNGHSQVYEISDLKDELTIGTICHENGHALLGYPDLYKFNLNNKDGQSAPLMVGSYCLMGNGNHNENGKNPVPPNPYLRYVVSKFKGNVTDLNSINDGTILSLKSNEKGFGDVYKWKNPDNDRECMMIENLQKKGRYRGIHNSGLVVWNGNGDDISIVYSNNPRNFSFGQLFTDGKFNELNRVVTPNAKWDYGKESGLKFSNVSESKEEMTFQKGCAVKPGLYNVKGEIFYVINEDGETAKGFNEIDSKMYYFNEDNGDAVLGLTKLNNKKYYFDETTGEMKKGFIEIENKKYYFDETTGEMKFGWFTLDGKTYHADEFYGQLGRGLEVIKNKNYYFDKDGVYEPDKTGFVFTGDYKVLDNTDYNLDCKNQVTMGSSVNFKAGVIGDIDYYDYTYSVSYRAVQAPAEEFKSSRPYAFSRFEFKPEHIGYCSITVTATDTHGNTYTDSIIVDVSPELKIDSFTINDEKVNIGSFTEGEVGEEVDLKAIVNGGYKYDDTKYCSCEIEAYDEDMSECPDNNETITGLTSPELKWTPKAEGTYKLKFKVQDVLGNVSEKDVWYLTN